jgi:AcrR family transcriptional regulator
MASVAAMTRPPLRGPSSEEPFGRERLAELQRARILTALLRVVRERGAAGVTVAHVIEHAGISRRTFYEIFNSSDECLLAAFEDAVAQIAARVVPAYRGAGSWRERVRAALVELLSFAQEQPLPALVALGEPPAGDGRLPARREQVRRLLIAAIDEGREQSARTAAPGPLAAECVLGGVGAILSARLAIFGVGAGASGTGAAAERSDLLSLTGPLMSMIVLPYLGAAAARAELERAAPSPAADARGGELPPADPFKAAGMRLTYRTVRVLSAIGEHPGASNRAVATVAEVSDQGQVSKLLRRLARAGMAANAGAGARTGAPNAWTLTERGEQVVSGIRAHTPDGERESGR